MSIAAQASAAETWHIKCFNARGQTMAVKALNPEGVIIDVKAIVSEGTFPSAMPSNRAFGEYFNSDVFFECTRRGVVVIDDLTLEERAGWPRGFVRVRGGDRRRSFEASRPAPRRC